MRLPDTSHGATWHVTWGHPTRHFLNVSWCKPSIEKNYFAFWNLNKLDSIFLRWKPCSEGHIGILQFVLLYKSQNITKQSERCLYSSSAVGCFLLLRYYTGVEPNLNPNRKPERTVSFWWTRTEPEPAKFYFSEPEPNLNPQNCAQVNPNRTWTFNKSKNIFFPYPDAADDSRGLTHSIVNLIRTKNAIGKDLNNKSSAKTKKDRLLQNTWENINI